MFVRSLGTSARYTPRVSDVYADKRPSRNEPEPALSFTGCLTLAWTAPPDWRQPDEPSRGGHALSAGCRRTGCDDLGGWRLGLRETARDDCFIPASRLCLLMLAGRNVRVQWLLALAIRPQRSALGGLLCSRRPARPERKT